MRRISIRILWVLAIAALLIPAGGCVALNKHYGDGLTDLIVGAPYDDLGATDIGAVYIYPGEAGSFLADEPSRVLTGRLGGDRFGWSIAACDFNADGRVDLAIGAYDAEDRNRTGSPQASSPLDGARQETYSALLLGVLDAPQRFLC